MVQAKGDGKLTLCHCTEIKKYQGDLGWVRRLHGTLRPSAGGRLESWKGERISEQKIHRFYKVGIWMCYDQEKVRDLTLWNKWDTVVPYFPCDKVFLIMSVLYIKLWKLELILLWIENDKLLIYLSTICLCDMMPLMISPLFRILDDWIQSSLLKVRRKSL